MTENRERSSRRSADISPEDVVAWAKKSKHALERQIFNAEALIDKNRTFIMIIDKFVEHVKI